MALTPEQLESFRSLEEAMWKSETRGNREWMAKMVAPTFTEYGRSGRVYDAQSILEIEIPDHIDVELPFGNFAGRILGDDVVLLTYVCVVGGVAANRASVWTHNGEHWVMDFHQGTTAATNDGPAAAPAQPMDSSAPLIDTAALRAAVFDTVMRGYDKEEVDRLVAHIADRIDAGDVPTAAELGSARFELALRGYDCEQVDERLANLRDTLS